MRSPKRRRTWSCPRLGSGGRVCGSGREWKKAWKPLDWRHAIVKWLRMRSEECRCGRYLGLDLSKVVVKRKLVVTTFVPMVHVSHHFIFCWLLHLGNQCVHGCFMFALSNYISHFCVSLIKTHVYNFIIQS